MGTLERLEREREPRAGDNHRRSHDCRHSPWDESWDHILEGHKVDVTDIDLLIAPHHGRKSGRSYKFLSTLRPTLTFFSNARSDFIAYGSA